MTTPCEMLDDFLSHDLASDDFVRFLEHLPRCPECKQTVAAEVQLDRLLWAAVDHEPLPRSIQPAPVRRLDRRKRWLLGSATAAVAASVAAIWLVARPRPLPLEIDRPRIDDAPAMAAVRVKFPAGDVIAVPEPLDAPNVTFLWVHPTLSRNSEGSLP